MSDEINDDDLTLYPEWKQALKEFIAAGFAPGETVPHEWFIERFGLASLPEKVTVKEYQDRQFKLLQSMDSLRTALLEQHCIALENVTGVGYRIVPPAEQTGAAMAKLKRDMRLSMRKAANTLQYTKTAALTDEQRRERSDAIAKLQMLRGAGAAALKNED